MKYFLGIYHGHNSTAALINSDGVVVECVSEERFRNQKNFQGFPTEVIRYFENKYSDLTIEKVGLPFEFMNNVFLSSNGSKKQSTFNNFLGKVRSVLLSFDREIYDYIYGIYNQYLGRRNAKLQVQFTAKYLNLKEDQVRGYNHQLCHAYTAYYLSPYNKEDALVLTLDGEGDGLCATVNIVRNGVFKTIASTPLGNSLGWLYMDLTQYLGMKPNEHEYKVMGLAPYAKDEHVLKAYSLISDWIQVDGLVFRSKFDTHLAYKKIKEELEGIRFDNLSGAFQKLVEDKICEWVKNAIKETNLNTVCCAGGVFMNVKANMKVSQMPEVKKLWVMPSGGDESTPMGAAIAAYLDYHKEENQSPSIKSLKSLYLGPSFTNEEIKNFLNFRKYDQKYDITYHTHIESVTARLLAEGHVVARMAGRMEFGARALGNRSILANASKPDVIREINEYIKNRDFWMPFAGSIIEDREKDYIVNPKNISSDYMIMSFDSTQLAIDTLRSAMHPYDFTIRPQIVKKEWNPNYYRIISEFENITGVGGILNTSFNLHGYPIVLGPKESMFVFENSGIKYLVLENYLVTKRGQ